MLLKSMTLTNFRQFNGTQSINFSVDPEKNVTVIMGENGSGKTTLAQAFTWCLYGSTDSCGERNLYITGNNLPAAGLSDREVCKRHCQWQCLLCL